ncbi:MAG TPA: penicillin-binding protein 2 [Roseiflexaceae bacterium]|nr:penicillin-binding protein 2 [Roseiflexaceae bacterium]
MRYFARALLIVAALALLVFGMTQPIDDDARWLLALWAAAPLLLLAARLSLPPRPRGTARSVQNLGVVVALGFGLLSLQLLRQQFVRAGEIANAVFVDEQTGQPTSNVRHVIEALRVRRGKMIDRNGMVLVDTRVVEGGFAVRTYPLAEQFDIAGFSGVIGFFSDRFGTSGLEATFGPYLDGERDSFARLQDQILGRPQVGDDIRLTIDARLQDRVARLLGDRAGSVVVLDPRTGAVLAMVSKPGYDPRLLAFDPSADREAENARIQSYWEQLNSEGAGQPLLNRPTQGRYPPGSTFKTVTAVAALLFPREVMPDQIDCPNARETEPGAPPVVNAVPDLFTLTGNPSDLERVYAYSCNTAFAEYALRLGWDRERDRPREPNLLAETAVKFDIVRPGDARESYAGFDDLLTLPSLLYVDPGFLNSRAGLADTGFGQGQLLITPLQMAMVAATVANDGLMMEPYLVERVTRPEGGLVTARGPRAIRRVMPGSVAAVMRRNMRAGVEYGFGRAAQQLDPAVMAVGGKSGTAEHIPGAVPHAWFIAIAPVDQPRFAVAVMVEQGGEGSRVGAELAGAVLAAAHELLPP